MNSNKKLIVVYKEEGAAFYHKLTDDESLINYWRKQSDAYIYEIDSQVFFEFEAERDFFIKNINLWNFISQIEVNHDETFEGDTLLEKVIQDYEFSWDELSDQQKEEDEEETRFQNDLLEIYPAGKVIY